MADCLILELYFKNRRTKNRRLRKCKQLVCRAFSETLFATEPHVDFPLADSALPGKQTEQGKQGTLDHTFARKAAELLMATGWAGTHENLKRLSCRHRIRWQDTLSMS